MIVGELLFGTAARSVVSHQRNTAGGAHRAAAVRAPTCENAPHYSAAMLTLVADSLMAIVAETQAAQL